MVGQFSAETFNLYNPVASGSPLGYRAGSYTSNRPNQLGNGLQVTSPLAYICKPTVAANLFATDQSLNSRGFITLSNVDEGTGAVLKQDRVILDSPRGLKITSTSSEFTVNVSCYDIQNRQMSCFGNSADISGTHTFILGRIPASIVSIRISGVDISTFECNVSTTYIFALPYNNFGIDAFLRNVNYGNNLLFKPVIEAATPYFTEYFPITSPDPTTPQTANSGTSLPFIDLTDAATSVTFDGQNYLVMEQFLPVNNVLIQPPFQEVPENVKGYTTEDFIGVAPYNINWEAWNG